MELDLSKGEFSSDFIVDRIAGNKKAVWFKDTKAYKNGRMKEKVLTVGKKNIDLFNDTTTVFNITRRKRNNTNIDEYRVNGEIILTVTNNTTKKRKK